MYTVLIWGTPYVNRAHLGYTVTFINVGRCTVYLRCTPRTPRLHPVKHREHRAYTVPSVATPCKFAPQTASHTVHTILVTVDTASPPWVLPDKSRQNRSIPRTISTYTLGTPWVHLDHTLYV